MPTVKSKASAGVPDTGRRIRTRVTTPRPSTTCGVKQDRPRRAGRVPRFTRPLARVAKKQQLVLFCRVAFAWTPDVTEICVESCLKVEGSFA
jgi:hypothetical protein